MIDCYFNDFADCYFADFTGWYCLVPRSYTFPAETGFWEANEFDSALHSVTFVSHQYGAILWLSPDLLQVKHGAS